MSITLMSKVSKVYADFEKKLNGYNYLACLGWLYVELEIAGLSNEEAREYIHNLCFVDDWGLIEAYQKEKHKRDVWNAVEMGSSCSPSGEW